MNGKQRKRKYPMTEINQFQNDDRSKKFRGSDIQRFNLIVANRELVFIEGIRQKNLYDDDLILLLNN
jgi:hypothetical protein